MARFSLETNAHVETVADVPFVRSAIEKITRNETKISASMCNFVKSGDT